jgi:murein hydrolase activator
MRKLIILFSLILISWAGFAQQSSEELKKRQQELQNEINELNSNLNAVKQNKKKYMALYAIVQRKVAAREELINNISREIRNIDENIFLNEREVYRLGKELDTLKQNYAKSIQFAYKNRSSYEYLNFIFSSVSFNDAVKRMNYLKSYRRLRETQAETISKTQTLMQQKIGDWNKSKTEKGVVLQNQSSQLKVLEEDRQEQAQVVNQIKNQEKDLQAQLKKKDQENQRLRKALTAAIRAEVEEANRKAKIAAANKKKEDDAKIKSAANTPTPTKPQASNKTELAVEPAKKPVEREYSAFESTPEGLTLSLNFEKNRGRLPWPIDAGTITGHYGKEIIPGTKLTVENDGIILGTRSGNNVKSIADGQVVRIMDLGEYQTVMISHGKYFSVYNRLASINVSKGDKVQAGTVLGKAFTNPEGEGEIELLIMNEKSRYLNPQQWIKAR